MLFLAYMVDKHNFLSKESAEPFLHLEQLSIPEYSTQFNMSVGTGKHPVSPT